MEELKKIWKIKNNIKNDYIINYNNNEFIHKIYKNKISITPEKKNALKVNYFYAKNFISNSNYKNKLNISFCI